MLVSTPRFARFLPKHRALKLTLSLRTPPLRSFAALHVAATLAMTQAGLTDDVSGLDPSQCLGIKVRRRRAKGRERLVSDCPAVSRGVGDKCTTPPRAL